MKENFSQRISQLEKRLQYIEYRHIELESIIINLLMNLQNLIHQILTENESKEQDD